MLLNKILFHKFIRNNKEPRNESEDGWKIAHWPILRDTSSECVAHDGQTKEETGHQ